MEKTITNSVILATGLTALSYAIGIPLGWTSFYWLEFLAVITSYSCTILFVWQKRFAYQIGILTTALYSVLFYQLGMVALAAFNLYLVFSLIYGWFRWGPDERSRPVGLIDKKWYLGYIGLAIAILLLYLGVYNVIDPNAIYELNKIDVGLAVASGLAQFMLDNKKIENWLLWILIDIVSIPFFIYSGLFIVAFQYLFFLGNAVYGFMAWRKEYNG